MALFFDGPRAPYRFQTGLLLLSLPRRRIRSLSQFGFRGLVEAIPYPVAQGTGVRLCCPLVKLPLSFRQPQVQA